MIHRNPLKMSNPKAKATILIHRNPLTMSNLKAKATILIHRNPLIMSNPKAKATILIHRNPLIMGKITTIAWDISQKRDKMGEHETSPIIPKYLFY